jgi:hypothetical protein
VAVNSKALIKRLAAPPKRERGNTMLYLNKDLFAEFKKTCGTIAPSKVIEALMAEFVADHKAKSGK